MSIGSRYFLALGKKDIHKKLCTAIECEEVGKPFFNTRWRNPTASPLAVLRIKENAGKKCRAA